jgi:hypothetical protein
MSKITLLYNKSNTFGIARDVEGIVNALGQDIKHADPLEPPVPTDIAIHLEIPVYVWMPWAATNILVVNPEWFESAWVPYMPRFQYVVYKDPFSAKEAIAAGYVKEEQVRVVPWGAASTSVESKKNPKGTADTGFVWFLGASKNKRAYVPKLLPLWRETYPPLRIYTVEPLDLSGTVIPSNVRIEVSDLDKTSRTQLAAFFRGHVGCSMAEGFSYAAAEAEWQGAFTLLNDLNCYKADYTGKEGVYFITDTLDAIIKEFEQTDFVSLAEKRRAQAEKRYAAFVSNVRAMIDDAKKLGRTQLQHQLPPVLSQADCPPISIVTLMYNRRRFFDLGCHNIMSSDYPPEKIEWILIEDSDDPMEDASDLITAVANKSQTVKIVYVPLKKKLCVAAKRNLGVERASNEIVLMMDDDDHYPVTSFRRRVAWLTGHPWKPKAVAATTIACYDLVKGISAVNVPPFGIPLGQRISEATLAFYKSWWMERKFPTAVQVGEGEEFVVGRELDVIEIPPQQIIVAFSHGKNTSSRRIPSDAEVKPGCFWGFPKEFLVFIHGIAGVKIVS